MTNTYTVTVKNQGGQFPIKDKNFNVKNIAISQAKQWAKENPDNQVFIEFFRKSDGQQGYINQDGFDLIGSSWTKK